MNVMAVAGNTTVPAIGFLVIGVLGVIMGLAWRRLLQFPIGKALLQASTFRKKPLPEEAFQTARRLALGMIGGSIVAFFIGLVTLIA